MGAIHFKSWIFPALIYLAALVWLALLPICVFAERLPIKTYTVADGLLRDYVYRIKQDSKGFIWFCTPEGVSRFDGSAFTNFTTDDGLPDRHVNDFLETRSGVYLIATDSGLAKLNPRGARHSAENPLFTNYSPDNQAAKEFHVLFEDASGVIWAGTSDGLFRLRERSGEFQLEAVALDDVPDTTGRLTVNALTADKSGALWIGTEENGLLRLLPTNEIERFTTADGLAGSSVKSLFADAAGQIWAGLHDDKAALIRLTIDSPASNHFSVAQKYSTRDGLPGNWVTALTQTSDGRFWVATTRGLCLWQNGDAASVCRMYTAQNDVCDFDVWNLLEDKNGNLWIGSRCGAKKLAQYGFTSYDKNDGFAVSLINSIFENKNRELFVSVVTDGGRIISKFENGKFIHVKPNLPEMDYFGWGWNQTVLEDSRENWWVPTSRGVFRFPKIENLIDLARLVPEKIATGAEVAEVFRLFEDSRGDIWLATTSREGKELLHWERAANLWRNVSRETGIGQNRFALSFAEDKSGSVWIGTGLADSALIRYRNGEFKVFTQADGAPSGWTRDLYVDDAGRLWLANTAAGLLRLDDLDGDKVNFVRYTTADGLSSSGAMCVTGDSFGRIYVGTARGIDRLDPDTFQIENFTTADGLPSSYIEVAFRDSTKALWFGTTAGVTSFQPEPVRTRQPPTLLITGMSIGGMAQPVSILGEREIGKIALNSDQRQISVDFIGLGANLGEKLRYEYRLSGAEWTHTNERAVNFANLAAGDYQFEIRAVTADRIAGVPAILSFKIAAPLWQQWWFLALSLALASAAIYGVYRYRLNKLLEVERTRMRIATDLHDDIGTNLSKISLLSEILSLKFAGNNAENNRLLNSIAEISRASVTSMSDIVWAINPQRDSVLDMTRRMRECAEEIFIEQGVLVKFAAPVIPNRGLKLAMNTRRELFLVFKEAVNNAAKHSGCTEFEVILIVAGGELSLEINDDGGGFDVSQTSGGNGLLNMKNRVEKMRGSLAVENREPCGTRIRLRVPHV